MSTASSLNSYKYSKILITAMLGSVSSPTATPHSCTEKALLGAQLPWVPFLLILRSEPGDSPHLEVQIFRGSFSGVPKYDWSLTLPQSTPG